MTNADKLKELAQTSPYAGCTANAPMAFVACYRKECRMPEYAPIDLSASVENLLLEADELGLGAVWLGIASLRDRMDKVREVISGRVRSICDYSMWLSDTDKESAESL